MDSLHFVTGATGLVGGAIVLRLLEATDARIACVVRSPHGSDAQQRLEGSLQTAAELYGQPQLAARIRERCIGIRGDIVVGLAPTAQIRSLGPISMVWHCAASLNYEEEDRHEVFSANLTGTQNVARFAEAVGAETFNHISTSYVAGKTNGYIAEEPAPADVVTSNCYEESKIAAERFLFGRDAFRLRVLRPSIVIGHSATSCVTSFSGLYGFIRDVRLFRRKVSRQLGELLSHRALSVIAEPDKPINFIPVDWVAEAAVHIGLSGSDKTIFHLTNDAPPKVGNVMRWIFEDLNLQRPRFVDGPRTFTSLDEILDKALGFYTSYMVGYKVFDRTNASSVEGVYRGAPDMEPERMRAYIRWYVDYAVRGGNKGRINLEAARSLLPAVPSSGVA